MTIGPDGLASHPYVGFSMIAAYIEVLGACLDNEDWSKQGLSESRFRAAITELFPVKYHQYNQKGNQFDLYVGLRCSLVHALQPGASIGLSERKHEIKANTSNKHLTIQNNELLLVYEDLLNDFKDACQKVITMIDDKELSGSKVYNHKISVPGDTIN
ncbi:MAG: hypothetical protein MUF50_02805 [Planctomycetes bacterium]|nr:hypothetical protein [Planctomycetota bacterium]